MESSQGITSEQSTTPFPIILLFPLPLVDGLEERLKHLRTLDKVDFEKSKPSEGSLYG